MKQKTCWVLGAMALLLLSFVLYVLLSPKPELDFSALTPEDISQIQLYPGTYENPNSYLATLSRDDTEAVLALLRQIDSHAQIANAVADNSDWAYQFRISFTDTGVLSLGAEGTRYCLDGAKIFDAGAKEQGLIQEISKLYDRLCVKYYMERFGDFNLDFYALQTSDVAEILVYSNGEPTETLPLFDADTETLLEKLCQVELGSRVLSEEMSGFRESHVKEFHISLQDGTVFDFAASGQWYYINGTEQTYYSKEDTSLIGEISRLYYQLEEVYFGA